MEAKPSFPIPITSSLKSNVKPATPSSINAKKKQGCKVCKTSCTPGQAVP